MLQQRAYTKTEHLSYLYEYGNMLSVHGGPFKIL